MTENTKKSFYTKPIYRKIILVDPFSDGKKYQRFWRKSRIKTYQTFISFLFIFSLIYTVFVQLFLSMKTIVVFYLFVKQINILITKHGEYIKYMR